MSRTVIVQCACCGELRLHPSAVRVVLCTDPARSHYVFTCPHCHDATRKPATPDIVQALIRDAGITPELWVIPAEALEIHVGPPLCTNDLLDLLIELDTRPD